MDKNTQLLTAIASIYKLHEVESTVLISNGTLQALEAATDLEIPEYLKPFIEKSKRTNDEWLGVQMKALEEAENDKNDALAAKQALEQKELELKEALTAAELARDEADAYKVDAERERDDVKKQLEQTAEYDLKKEREKAQAKHLARDGWRAYSLAFGLLILYVFFAQTDVLAAILGACTQQVLSVYSVGGNSVFSAREKEVEKKKE
jgi:hypothetical protein